MTDVIQKACKLCRLCRRMALSRGSLMRRMNSAPSPMCQILAESGKENTFLTTSSSLAGASNFLLPPSPSRTKNFPEDHDTASQDSGCSEDSSNNIVRFAVPSGLPPRKGVDPSPGKSWFPEHHTSSPPSPMMRSPGSFRPKSMRSLSFCSTDSFDDGFSELADIENKSDENAPIALGSLLTGPLLASKDNDSCITPSSGQRVRRALSLVENNVCASKRPGELDGCNGLLKRRKPSLPPNDPLPRHKLQRSASENCATLLSSTLSNLYGRPELIADFSCPYALPVVTGKHPDLTSIAADTLAAVMRNQYASTVKSFTIIDCRYPYEFQGGHIKGATNLFTFEQVEEALLKNISLKPTDESGHTSGREILIFHCEFSVARGPSMYRWLRRLDRNLSAYPSLQYPEVYLLDGGYKEFYNSHPTLCEPHGYTPMQDPKHEADFRKFRTKASSWSASRKRLQLL